MFSVTTLLNAEWQDEPFRHTVIDGLWDDEFLRGCRAEFPAPDDPRWAMNNDPEEYGKRAADEPAWGPMTREFFRKVRHASFEALMEDMSGIEYLTSDDIGGGMHETGEGGRLEMHIDFNVHPSQPLERRLNMLVFLNEDWKYRWGGVIQLGRRGDPNAIEMLPLFNRTLIFECSDQSYHGHPDPIVGDHLRQSLACYFYAPLRAGVLEKAHTTVWNAG